MAGPSEEAAQQWEDLERFVQCMSVAIKPPGLGRGGPSSCRALTELLSTLGEQGELLRLSLISMLIEQPSTGPERWVQIVELARNGGRHGVAGAGVLLLKARALRALGLPSAAEAVLEGLLGVDRLEGELRLAALYERALAQEELGDVASARRSLEQIFAAEPGYADVADRLGVGAKGGAVERTLVEVSSS